MMSVDWEDWYQTESFRRLYPVHTWGNLAGRLPETTPRVLDALSAGECKATFFVVGYNAKRYPHLLKDIVRKGHEVGLHGYDHTSVFKQDSKTFSKELIYCRKMIEDITGKEVTGFRAPNWSITPAVFWALDILKEQGIRYVSGMDQQLFLRYEFCLNPELIQFPRNSLKAGPLVVPFGGGFFLRAYPYPLTKLLVERVNRQKQRVLCYIHPWELDENTPCKGMTQFWRIVTTFNLKKMKKNITRFLNDFNFVPIGDVIKSV